MRQGQPARGNVSRSVMSGKLAARAMKAWGWEALPSGAEPSPEARTWRGEHGNTTWVAVSPDALEPIGLHECRHTYASLLVAAGYTLKEVMEYMGHADLQTTSRYVKRLPQPREDNAADRLKAYLTASDVG